MNENVRSGALRAGIVVVLTGALAACGGSSGTVVPKTGADAQAPSSAVRAVGAVTRADGAIDVTLMHGRRVQVEFRTQPGAACTAPASKPGHEVYADADGLVRFGMRPLKAIAAVSSFVLTCRLHGSVVKTVPIQAMHLAGEAPAEAVAAQAAPAPVTQGDVAAAKTRLGFDFETATKEQLLAHDLPPRPDRTDAYAGWLRVVTTPTKRILHQGVATPRYHQASTTSRIWSGYAIAGSSHEFETASGEWYIPQISTDCGGPGCNASVWPGVDGFGTNDVIQDGSESYLYFDMCSDTGCYDAVDGYYVWYEYYPNSEMYVFQAGANDDVWCEAWATSPTSSSSGGGFYCKDNTTQWVLSTSVGIPSGATFAGSTVEWILEAPTISGSPAALPDYSTAHMWGAYGAYTSNGSWFGYTQLYNYNVTMYNSPNTLSTAAQWTGHTYGIEWTWHNYGY